MNSVLDELIDKICMAYIDDIIVYGRDMEEHRKNLETVLKRLMEYDIKIKPAKCKFGFRRIEFMGYVVSDKGVELDGGKVEAIRKIKPPKSLKELQKFLGMVNYYRRFIHNFASKT